jgi:hypothetical protein
MQHRILSLGAGVQSTTLYMMAVDGQLQIDCAIFADTGDEPTPVYRHLEWLQSLNGPPIMVRSLGVKLGNQLLKGLNGTGQRFVSIPAFNLRPDGSEALTRRQCTKEFKTSVIDRTVRREILGLRRRQRTAKGTDVTQIIGISFEERHRAASVVRRFADEKWHHPEFPLIDMKWGRIRCMEYLEKRVPHPVPKSACVYCPYRGNAEWRWLKEHDPAGWERAVEVDAALRKPGNVCNRDMDQPMFVHRSCVPLPMVDFSERDTLNLFSAKECQGMCGV